MDIQKARNILNLKYNYTHEDLKKNYRLLALKHHPDKNANSNESCENFKEVNAAYLYLSNFDISHDAHASHGFKGEDNQDAKDAKDAEEENGGPGSYIFIFRVFIQSLLQK